ncbi:MAG: prepilin-type N-terminal cleavage/methylation domain-containing protein [Clostridiales bacterium]|jgi:type II secretory pathway pseudopilin PulG|nr:prepilin-type N-terminal cleavage/methylation domain-containing protein [Eubacteriales bacterium]MDH7565254.1 prepilin-type N-terminal cleavage/methylation domain-containing protein [Clostridiales bacterium]
MAQGGQKGITLTELLVTVAILMVVMLPISMVLLQGDKNYRIEKDTSDSQRAVREAMDLIMEDLRQNDSSSISVYKNNNSSDAAIPALGAPQNSGDVLYGDVLYIKPDIIYFLGKDGLYKNDGTSSNLAVIGITGFTVSKRLSDSNTVSTIIDIDLYAKKSPKDRGINLKSSYRIKSN